MKATLEIIDIPPQNYAMIDGTGNPNGNPDFQAAIEALYGVSYTLKFARKKAGLTPDYKVGTLEALWLADQEDFDWSDETKKANWRWTLMIAQPDFIDWAEFTVAVEALAKKNPNRAIGKLYLKTLTEGTAVQILHIGPYDHEGPDIKAMHAYAYEQGYRLTGQHHEIYLSDPRRAKPEKLRTLLRHPVQPVYNNVK